MLLIFEEELDMSTQERVLTLHYGLNFAQPGVTNWGMELQKFMDNKDNAGKPLRLVYNCVGGNIFDATYVVQMQEEIMQSDHHLTTCIFGRAASCTAWVARHAHCVMIGEDSEIMIHRVKPCEVKMLHEMEEEVARCQALERKTFSQFIEGTAITMEELVAATAFGKEWNIGAVEAVERKLADKIVPRIRRSPISLEEFQAAQKQAS
jgi:ATP-dependent protease ClpP protease subunit